MLTGRLEHVKFSINQAKQLLRGRVKVSRVSHVQRAGPENNTNPPLYPPCLESRKCNLTFSLSSFRHLPKLAELSVSHLVVLGLAVELLCARLHALLNLLHQLGVLISGLLEPSGESCHLLLGTLHLFLDLYHLSVQTLAVLLQVAVFRLRSVSSCKIAVLDSRHLTTRPNTTWRGMWRGDSERICSKGVRAVKGRSAKNRHHRHLTITNNTVPSTFTDGYLINRVQDIMCVMTMIMSVTCEPSPPPAWSV